MAKKETTAKKPAAKKAAAPAKKATAKKTTTKKVVAKKVEKIVDQTEPQHIGLVRNDSWLEPFEGAIRGRHDHAVWKINQLTPRENSRILPLVIFILDFTNSLRVGCSVSGHLMPLTFT